MNLGQALVACCSADPNIRGPGEQQIAQMEQINFPAYVGGLVNEFANEQQQEVGARHMAGVCLKNCLVAKDERRNFELQQRWLELENQLREHIRSTVVHTLACPIPAIRKTAANVIAKIAAIEVPKTLWPDLIRTLVGNIAIDNDHIRESSFQALGYVCSETAEYLQEHSNTILNAISSGMKPEEKNVGIQLAATECLANSLDFCKQNFAAKMERDLIMQMIFSMAQSREVRVRVAAYQCLVAIAHTYYDFLDSPLGDSASTLVEETFNLTSNAIRTDEEDVILQAIEFWSTICDEEIEIVAHLEDAAEMGVEPQRKFIRAAEKALGPLMPLLMEQLVKQSEEIGDDTWTEAVAAGTCIDQMAQATRDEVVDHVLPFVQRFIESENWREKEAALAAFGAIMDGPSPEKLEGLVNLAFPIILAHMQDNSPLVKDTAAWTIGRICDFVPGCTEPLLQQLMEVLVTSLRDVPKVAANCAWALFNLASAVQPGEEESTSPLSPFFEGTIVALLECADRQDADEHNLMTSCYESINALIASAAEDTYELIGRLIPALKQRLLGALDAAGVNQEEQQAHYTVQGLLVAAIQTIVNQVDPQVVLPHCEDFMTMFLRVLQSKVALAHEETFMAVACVANRVGGDFKVYMDNDVFREAIMEGLKNYTETRVCITAVGLVGDISRCLGERIIPYCDQIMHTLLANLQEPVCHRTIKPSIIICLGDIGLAIQGHFERYIPYVMRMLHAASVKACELCFKDMSEDDREYVDSLRSAILDAYTGILQGLGPEKSHLFNEYAKDVVDFLEHISKDQSSGLEVARAALGVISDIAQVMSIAKELLSNRPGIEALVRSGTESSDERVRQAAALATEMYQQL